MKVAVTGAAGRLGKYVVQELLEHGHEVKGLSLVPAAEIAIPQVAVDITEFDQVFKGLDECEAIIHLAAIPTPYETRPNDVLMANTIGTNNVLQAAIARKIKRIACASSDSAFGLVLILGTRRESFGWPSNKSVRVMKKYSWPRTNNATS